MQSSRDRLNILIAAAHITLQLLTASFNDQHECKQSKLRVKHSGWGPVDYVRPSRPTGPPGPGLKTETTFYKFSDIRCQCSKTSELLKDREREKEKRETVFNNRFHCLIWLVLQAGLCRDHQPIIQQWLTAGRSEHAYLKDRTTI